MVLVQCGGGAPDFKHVRNTHGLQRFGKASEGNGFAVLQGGGQQAVAVSGHLCQALREAVHEQNREFRIRRNEAGGFLGDVFALRYDQRAHPAAVHQQFAAFYPASAAFGSFTRKNVGGEDHEVELVAQQFLADNGTAHGFAAPVGLSLKQQADLRYVLPVREEIAEAVDVLHQFAEPGELGVVAAGIEVRRAVIVRVLRHRESVGYKVVYALADPVIGQPLHVAHTQPPAVGTEVFAHQASVLFRVNRCGGSAELAQIVMVEGRLDVREARVAGGNVIAGHQLITDVIDAGHMLAFNRTEVVSDAGAEAHVAAVVLDNVADILHAVRLAPVAELGGKVFAVQGADGVHICNAQPAVGIVVMVGKQQREIPVKVLSVALQQHLLELPAPGQRHPQTDEAVLIVALAVVEAGLIGEEAGDHRTEEVGIALVVLLVHFINQQADGVGLNVIDVLGLEVEGRGDKVHVDAPDALGNVGSEVTVLNTVCEVERFALLVVAVRHAAGGHGNKPCLFQQGRVVGLAEVHPGKLPGGQQVHVHLCGRHRADHIHKLADEEAAHFLGVILHGIVCHAGGEVRIVQDPDGHVPLLRLVDDDVNVMPPGVTGVIRMRPGFQTDGTDARFVDFCQLRAQNFFAFSSHPEKRENVVVVHGVLLSSV